MEDLFGPSTPDRLGINARAQSSSKIPIHKARQQNQTLRLSLYDKAFKQQLSKQMKREEAIFEAKASSNTSKINRASVELSLTKSLELIDNAISSFQEDPLNKEEFLALLHKVQICRELTSTLYVGLEEPILKIMKTRIGFEYRFLQRSWDFLSSPQEYISKDNLTAFLKIVLQPRTNKQKIAQGLTALNFDTDVSIEQLTKDFWLLNQEQLSYKKGFESKFNKKQVQEYTFKPKICKRSKEMSVAKPNPDKRYEVLYNKQWVKGEKITVEKRKQLDEEVKDCTFKPTLVAKHKANKTKNENKNTRSSIDFGIRPKDYRSSIDRELEHCAFHPLLTAEKPTNDKNHKPKGFQESIERLRLAAKLKKEKQDVIEKIPNGENYDKMRNLPAKEFTLATQNRNHKEVLLYVDIEVSNSKRGRIAIHPGDEPSQLASNFCTVFKLGPEMQEKLENHLKEQISSLNIE